MMANDTADDLKRGFEMLGDGFREAGYRRNMELVAKQGFVGFKRKNAALAFQQDEAYKGWKCLVEQGEYRFYPPENKKKDGKIKQEEPNLFEVYKSMTSDLSWAYSVYVNSLPSGKFLYRLVACSEKTGELKELQRCEIDFEGAFIREVVPSIYYNMCGKMPGIDYTKGDELTGFIFTIDSIDCKRRLGFGGLNKEQLTVLEEMKAYIDEKYMNIPRMESNSKK